ncbi:unnamed protein product [Rotaria socialis]|uniref:RNase III domain-containing protein n=1 Tax=Rotaria socialis TaxID=392032 RepID=A0A821H7G4_9BILA|nr:unnamed protein product [Rotaria socialis]
MSDLEHVLGYRFKNKDILKQSLTHASALHENHPKASYRDQSSLAFVGDAVLNQNCARETSSGRAYYTGQRTCSSLGKMHADCMEAILGAIALDCGVDQQKVIFDVIEKLCSDRYQTLLKPIETIRLKSACDEEEEDYINVSRYVFLRDQARPLSQKLIVTDNSHKRTHWQKLGQVILWLFAICGFLTILWLIANFIIFQLSVDVENQGWEF